MTENDLKAFVIEDNPALNTLFCDALRSSGFSTEGILDGQASLQRLDKVQPQLIMLDLHLPKVSGAELLDKIRQDPRLKESVVIVASADGTWSGIVREKADFVLNKPVSYVQLRDIGLRIYQNLVKAQP
jgi:CheY-like chemotaxis protein